MEEVRCVRNARICLCVLCGLPAAGKSKLAQVLHEHLEKRGFGAFVLSYDELIPDEPFEFNTGDGDQNRGVRTPTSFAHFCVTHVNCKIHTCQNCAVLRALSMQSSWKMRRQRVLRTLARFLHRGCADDADAATWTRLTQELHQLRARGHQSALVILLDDNFYYQSMRYEVYQLARRYSMGFCQLYVQRPVTSCLRRNRTRSCPLPDEVIVAMEKRLEPPNPLKNSWEQSSLTMTSEDGFSPQGIELSIDLIAASLDNPLSPIQDDTEQKEADRQRCTSSVMHQADQACRRLVSQAMQSARGQ
ncbi:L-seryl-tRNA(Sec) kinase-like [Scleropages formosus]|uniref:L-seryl-tRNA(Sec) kinase-like n=1 Tax=Scleropages formosus TaxID=113540 RepID=A0A0P7UTN7_SCLFO|nr:L-seryl-tRNA(Sec) kinase-like [Scleropages formosus]